MQIENELALMTIHIYRAADAFLYLPMYIAEEYGLFETLLPDDIIKFETASGSDIKAIMSMLEQNNNTKDSMAIAIADPIAFLNEEKDTIKDIRVIGSIINKLPFWAVNHIDKEFTTIEEFKGYFTSVIHYEDNLSTGYYLGKLVKRISKIEHATRVAFHDAISVLRNSHTVNPHQKTIAITADIVSLAQAMCDNSKEPLYINYKFKNAGSFICTGILTSDKCCENPYGDRLIKIIEAVQKSIMFLYSSKTVAGKICTDIAKNQYASAKLNPQEINYIIKLIKDGDFYPADLNIDQMGWKKAIEARSKTEFWDDEHTKETYFTSFNTYVENKFIIESELSLATQFGIRLETFGVKKAILFLILKPLKSLWVFISFYKLFLSLLVSGTLISVYFHIQYQKSVIWGIIGSVLISLLVNLATPYFTRLNKNHDKK